MIFHTNDEMEECLLITGRWKFRNYNLKYLERFVFDFSVDYHKYDFKPEIESDIAQLRTYTKKNRICIAQMFHNVSLFDVKRVQRHFYSWCETKYHDIRSKKTIRQVIERYFNWKTIEEKFIFFPELHALLKY